MAHEERPPLAKLLRKLEVNLSRVLKMLIVLIIFSVLVLVSLWKTRAVDGGQSENEDISTVLDKNKPTSIFYHAGQRVFVGKFLTSLAVGIGDIWD